MGSRPIPLTPPHTTADAGHTIADRYLLHRCLGRGSEGEVWLAHDPVHRREVALKIAASVGPVLRSEFALLGRLGHPCLPRSFDLGQLTSGHEYLTREFFDAATLEEVAPSLTQRQAKSLLIQACRVMAYLEARDLVHGDLTPANLLIERVAEDVRLRIVDLGLAGRVGDGPRGEIRGTPRFAAPSVLEGEPPTPSSDLFSLGATFSDCFPSASGALKQVIRRLHEPDAEKRYQSADHVLIDFQPSTQQLDEGATRVEPELVGQEHVLEAFDAALAGTRRGPFALRGGPGSGKSRLLAECALRATLEGRSVYRVDGALGPAALDAPRRQALLEAEASPQDWLVAVEGQGALLVVDDADLLGASAAFLEPIARSSHALLVYSTTHGPQLAAPLELAPLEDDQARLLVASLFGHMARSDTSERIVACCAKHPGYLTRAARAATRLEAPAPGPRLDACIRGSAPACVEDATRAWFDTLEPEQRRVLVLVAVLHPPTPPTVVARLLSAPDQLHLDALIESGVVRKADDGLRLDSALLRWLCLEHPSTLERKRLEARAGDAWADSGAGARSEHTERAHHYLAAGDEERAFRHGLPAIAAQLEHKDARSARALVEVLLTTRRGAQIETASQLQEAWADALFLEGEARRARAVFERALELLRESDGAPTDEARLRTKLAVAHTASGGLERARTELEHARRLTTEGAPFELRVRIEEVLGQVQAQLGHPDEARATLLRATDMPGARRDHPALANVWNNLGILSRMAGKLAEAEEFHRRALGIRRVAEDLDGCSRSLTNLGNLASEAGRLDEARELFERSLELKERIGNVTGLVTGNLNLGYADLCRGDFAPAIQHFERARHLSDSVGDTSGRIQAHVAASRAWIEKGAHASALSEACTAARLARQRRDRIALAGALHARSDAERVLGLYASACTTLADNLELARELGDRVQQARVLAQLSEARLLDQVEPPREAQRAAAQAMGAAIDLLRAAQQPQLLIECLLLDAERRSERHEPGARDLTAEALKLAQRTGQPKFVGQAHWLSAMIERQEGDLDRSSFHLNRALDHAARFASPELLWRTYSELAALHAAGGSERRCVAWLRRCVQVIRTTALELSDDKLASAYLSAPRRARALDPTHIRHGNRP